MSDHQRSYDDVMDRYNLGTEPLDNWTTADLELLISAIEVEIKERYTAVTADFRDEVDEYFEMDGDIMEDDSVYE